MSSLREVSARDMSDNPFSLIGDGWMLITAGDLSSYNMMTASWGGIGVLWGMDVSFVFVRPDRHTYGFMEKSEGFTLSFFDPSWKKALMYCGTHSGRDVDKASECGLTPVGSGNGVYFEEARMVMECRKIYFQDLIPGHFLVFEIEEKYPEGVYHRMYVGEIKKVLLRQPGTS